MKIRITYLFGLFLSFFVSVNTSAQLARDTISVNIEDANYMQGFSDSLRLLVGNVFLSQLEEELIFLCDSARIFDKGKSFNAYGNVHLQQSDSINIYADMMKYRAAERKAYLYKNVHLSDGTSDIYADMLVYDIATRQALLTPRVQINADSTLIYADTILYNTRNKQAFLYGNASLESNDMTLKSDEMDYNMITEMGHYKNGGELLNKTTSLTSRDATYWGKKNEVQFNEQVVYKDSTYLLNTQSLLYNLKTENAIFTGKSTIVNQENTINCEQGSYNSKTKKVSIQKNAIIEQENNRLKADSLAFDNETGKGIAMGNVFWQDTLQNTSLEGNYMIFEDASNYVLATQRPLMTQIVEQKPQNDTLYIIADTLFTQEISDSLRNFEAINKVLIYKKDFQSSSEFMQYNNKDSIFYFYGKPILWLENTQLYADTIILETQNNDPHKFSLLGNAFMATQVQEGIYNQLSGAQIYGYFVEGDLKNIEVNTQAKSIYFVQDDADKSFIGANESSAKNMYVSVDSNEVKRILYEEKASAKFLKMEQINPYTLALAGFSWQTDKRPNSLEDLLATRLEYELQAAKQDSINTEDKAAELPTPISEKRHFGSDKTPKNTPKKNTTEEEITPEKITSLAKDDERLNTQKRQTQVIILKAE